MVVSMTAVGPVGTGAGLTWLVVLGASGSCWGGGVDAFAFEEGTLRAKTNARDTKGHAVYDSNKQAIADARLEQFRWRRVAAALAVDELKRIVVELFLP